MTIAFKTKIDGHKDYRDADRLLKSLEKDASKSRKQKQRDKHLA